MNLDHAKEQVAKFASMDSNKDGSVTIQEFADFHRLPLSTPVKELFSVYDRVSEAGTGCGNERTLSIISRRGIFLRPRRSCCERTNAGAYGVAFFLVILNIREKRNFSL